MTAVELAIVLGFQLLGLVVLYYTIMGKVRAALVEIVKAVSALNAAVQQQANVIPFRRN